MWWLTNLEQRCSFGTQVLFHSAMLIHRVDIAVLQLFPVTSFQAVGQMFLLVHGEVEGLKPIDVWIR